MKFDSYIDWLNEVKKLPFKDIVFGVKDKIAEDTLYISMSQSKNIRMDNEQWTIGYTYALVVSVKSADSPLINAMANLTQDGLGFVNWSETSQLYNYSGTVYLPCQTGGNAFE